MLRALEMNGLERFGFDLTPEMVAEARVVLSRQGVPESHIWQGSVLDTAAFGLPAVRSKGQFDAAVCFGVLPHIPADTDRTVLQNLHDAVRPGGFVAVEARNALFALFSLNRYSRAFFRESLMDEVGLSSRSGDEAGARTKAMNPMGRVGTMEELQNLAVFLISGGCDWINGETIAMDGGQALAMGGNFYQLRDWSDADWTQARDTIKAQNEKDRAARG
jgi:SAM-dependent methyltransferase